MRRKRQGSTRGFANARHVRQLRLVDLHIAAHHREEEATVADEEGSLGGARGRDIEQFSQRAEAGDGFSLRIAVKQTLTVIRHARAGQAASAAGGPGEAVGTAPWGTGHSVREQAGEDTLQPRDPLLPLRDLVRGAAQPGHPALEGGPFLFELRPAPSKLVFPARFERRSCRSGAEHASSRGRHGASCSVSCAAACW